MLNVCQIRRLNRYPVDHNEDNAPENISPTEDWLNWNCDMDYPNDTKDNSPADGESDIDQGDGSEDLDCAGQGDVSATPIVPRLIRPTRKS
jgi:hypothetical protein